MYACSTEEQTTQQREDLILEHLPQVRLIARRIHERLPASVSIEDLVSAGTLGLIAAIDNFNAAHNVKLKTYAEYRIRGAILDGLRSQDWAPRQKRRMARDIEAAMFTVEQRAGRAATEDEIAAELNVPVEEYRQRLVEIEGLQIGELEQASEDSYSLLKYISGNEEETPARLLERAELERIVAAAIERMPKTERTVLSLYYHEELNLREIAGIMHLHLSRISQLKSQAILRLRAHLEKCWPTQRGI